MKKYSQVPPVLFARAIALCLRGRGHFPKSQNGDTMQEKEEFIVFRKLEFFPVKTHETSFYPGYS